MSKLNILAEKLTGWETPQDFFDKLHKEYRFTLDPCATKKNTKCKKFFTIEQDGLKQSWAGERVFMNPPYGRQVWRWVEKAYEESKRGALVVCLLLARTDTRWFHHWAVEGQIRFVKGRLSFWNGKKHDRCPAPSIVVVFKPRP